MGNICLAKERDEKDQDGKKPQKFDELYSEFSQANEFDKRS